MDGNSLASTIATVFSHIHEGDTPWRSDGLRDFFHRDLGLTDATKSQVIVQLVKANSAPEEGTGWHFHEARSGWDSNTWDLPNWYLEG